MKRVKFQDARNIRTQPADAAFEDGKLDLNKFLAAREFEIKALETSMKNCKAAGATRAFQQVPRAMRRRTASHNVKRVPKRLRQRARREQLEDNTPTVEARKRRPRTTRARIRAENAKRLQVLAKAKRKAQLRKEKEKQESAGQEGKVTTKPTVHTRPARPKIRRDTLNEPPKIKSKFKKRQVNKTWLPTHLWHAKRATMTESTKSLWGFAIPLTPTDKCYRPTHRASGQKGAVVWDMSYMSTIGVYGSASGLEQVLKALGLVQESLWGVRGRKWRMGTRKWSGLLSKQRKDSRLYIGPATIIWNPEIQSNIAESEGGSQPKTPQRQLLIRTHPSCFLELFNELLKLVKMPSPQLHVEDLRYEIGSIELTGPASTEALLSVLHPYYDGPEATERQGHIFRSLVGVTNPASLPQDALLAFSAKDPRLSYPPKKVPTGSIDSTLVETLAKWPVEENLKPYGIFSRDARYRASLLPPQKSINRRKGSTLPGNTLSPTAADPPIPVVLFTSRTATDGQAQGTWTLLAPWKCILSIWYSLVHAPLSSGGNPSLGGMNEQRQIAFEQGSAWFPADFPGTDAGWRWELEQRVKRKSDWDRRPKGKRVEWASLDLGAGRKGEIGDGLACDFEFLCGLVNESTSEIPKSQESSAPDVNTMDIDPPERASSDPNQDKKAVAFRTIRTEQMTKASFKALLASSTLTAPQPNSILQVRLTFVARGVASACARIYRLPTRTPTSTQRSSSEAEVPATDPLSVSAGTLPSDLREQWLRSFAIKPSTRHSLAPPRMPAGANMQTRKELLARSLLTGELSYPKPAANQTDIGGHPLCPDKEDLIGFVTTGSYSLSEGKGTAIGSISACRALDLLKRPDAKEGKLCIVRNAGENVGWLARWQPL